MRALAEAAEVTPVVLPSLQPPLPASDWLLGLDGLLLTGAVSNIEPQHYEGGRSWPGNPHDPARDANAFALLREALSLDLPVLAICRGFQELNVALGGSLHPQLHAVPGLADHREDPQAPVEVQYGAAHAVTLAADGWLAQWHGSDRVQVNSVHGRGIARLARGLQVEARADDGLVEAARSLHHGFVLGVQWHPGGASCRRRSITLFSVHSAKLAGSTNRTDWIPDEFPNAPAQDGHAARTAGKHPAALAEGAAHHRS